MDNFYVLLSVSFGAFLGLRKMTKRDLKLTLGLAG